MSTPLADLTSIRLDHRVGFDLDEDLRRDQPAHLDHAGGGADVLEDVAVGFAELCQRRLDILEDLDGLGVGVAFADERTVAGVLVA